MSSAPRSGRPDISVLPDDTRIRVSAKRYFSAHHMMIWAAKSALASAALPQGALLVIAVCAMAAEALANAIGQRLFVEWEDFDRLPPWSKYRLICRELDLACNRGDGVWQELHGLLRLRNSIAHAKPEEVRSDVPMLVGDYKMGSWTQNLANIFPPSELERQLSQDAAAKAIQTIETVLRTISDKLHGDDKDFIEGDIAEQEISLA